MSGIILLVILAIWFLVVKKLTDFFTSKIALKTTRIWLYPIVFILLFIAPVADEIIGGFQFRALCRDGTKIVFDADKIKGKKLLWSGTPRVLLDKYAIPIEEESTDWVDKSTGEKLITYKQYFAIGGWLSRFIAFNNITRPYTFDGVCGVKDEFNQLKKALNFKTNYKK